MNFSVFTKPWNLPIAELGERMAALGVAGIELPVRPGYAVNPENVAAELPKAARTLAGFGLAIASVAPPFATGTDEAVIAACGEAGVPLVRVMAAIPKDRGYLDAVRALQAEYDTLLPALERHGVTLGIQNHAGRYVANACGLRMLAERFDPRRVGIVWDPAHCALQGELPELAIDIVWSHLRLVNLKNGIWQRTNGPEAELAQYRHYWTSGRQGLCPWPTVAALLTARGYDGWVCLTAEYSDHAAADRLIAEDLRFARELLVPTPPGPGEACLAPTVP